MIFSLNSEEYSGSKEEWLKEKMYISNDLYGDGFAVDFTKETVGNLIAKGNEYVYPRFLNLPF